MAKDIVNIIRPEWIPSAYRKMETKEVLLKPKEETPGLKQDMIVINPATVPTNSPGLND